MKLQNISDRAVKNDFYTKIVLQSNIGSGFYTIVRQVAVHLLLFEYLAIYVFLFLNIYDVFINYVFRD